MPRSQPDQPELTPAQSAYLREYLPEGGPAPTVIVVPAAGRHPGGWIFGMVLVAVVTAWLVRSDRPMVAEALAQAGPAGSGAGARGIYAFTGQLTSKTYGLFMLDVDSGTIWCYELEHGPNGEPQMKLVAARSWIYDRFLEEFNVADPVPSAVKMLVQQQRAAQAASGAAGAAGGGANPPVRGPSAESGSGPLLPGPAGRQ